jgi:hypothetical protein
MKNIVFAILFLFATSTTQAKVPASIIKKYREIFKLIKAGNARELSGMIAYPIKRANPLKNITNAQEFVAYFPVLFDDAFDKKIDSFNESMVIEQHDSYGLVGGPFDGDLWLNYKGKLMAINYSSKKEKALRSQLTQQIKSKIYPGVNQWDENLMVLHSPKLLIRLDEVGRKIRYVSWSKGRSTAEKPDLILNNGVSEAQGTQGGWTFTFKNGDWTYVIDDVEMCEEDSQCGIFLRLSFKGEEKSSVKLIEIK